MSRFLESIDSSAEIRQLALALQQRVRIAPVREPLFFGQVIEFLEQSKYFRLAIVKHLDGIPRGSRWTHRRAGYSRASSAADPRTDNG